MLLQENIIQLKIDCHSHFSAQLIYEKAYFLAKKRM